MSARKHEIVLLVMDIDGTLTDGAIFYGSDGAEYKVFSAKDGLILKVLPLLGLQALFLTGRSSDAVRERAAELDCGLLDNVQNKSEILRAYLCDNHIDLESVAYIGDDLNDYAAMRLCGFKACPADAVAAIRELCDYVSPYDGGHGAVRDICEHILKQNEKYDAFLNLFGMEGIR